MSHRIPKPTHQPRKDTMSSAITTPRPGEQHAGGYYAGAIRFGADLFGIIVAPKELGETSAAWGKRDQDIPGARSYFDGMANTLAMVDAGCDVAAWARALTIGGNADWYIPARDELELLYRHLKPTAETNYVYRGDNPSSVPAGYPYTETEPGQTAVELFRGDAPDAFEEAWYWSSTQFSRLSAWNQHFDLGYQDTSGKSVEARVRAVRRFPLSA